MVICYSSNRKLIYLASWKFSPPAFRDHTWEFGKYLTALCKLRYSKDTTMTSMPGTNLSNYTPGLVGQYAAGVMGLGRCSTHPKLCAGKVLTTASDSVAAVLKPKWSTYCRDLLTPGAGRLS